MVNALALLLLISITSFSGLVPAAVAGSLSDQLIPSASPHSAAASAIKLLESGGARHHHPKSLEALLSQHFDVVFHVGECKHALNASTQGSVPHFTATAHHGGQVDTENDARPLCLSRHKHVRTDGGRRQLLRTFSTEPLERGAGAAALDGGVGWSQVLQPRPGPQRRRLRGSLRRLQQQQVLPPPSHHGSAVLSDRDLFPYNTMWPREALAYKAHLTALRLCAELLPPAEKDGRARTCVVVTEQAAWVAANDGGAMERSLRRDGVSNGAALAASLVARNSSTRTPQPPFAAFPWNDGRNQDREMYGMYDTTRSWLDAMGAGLSSAGIDPLHLDWDVLALPSACAGWAVAGVGTDSGATAEGVGGSSRGIAGCVLAFTRDAAAAAQAIATGAPATASSPAALLPMVNNPFYAKLALMARQGLLRMRVAAPAAPVVLAATPAESASSGAAAPGPGGGPSQLPRRRFLLFTNVGDQGIWRMWTGPDRNYDLLVGYYGSGNVTDIAAGRAAATGLPGGGGGGTAAGSSGDGGTAGGGARGSGPGRPDYAYRTHGSKHQNVHRLHSLYPGLLASYDVVAVWDDDLESSTAEVSAMFETFVKVSGLPGDPAGAWLGQPSLRSGSVVHHWVLANEPSLRLSYTSFIENNACVFRSDKLVELLDSRIYTGELMAWGVDYAYLAALGPTERDKYFVMHDHQVLNPHPATKPGGREIVKMASEEFQTLQWTAYSKRFGFPWEVPRLVYTCVRAVPSLPLAQYPGNCTEHSNLGRRRA